MAYDIIDKYIYGLTRTKSGMGRPDVVINVANTYHVYEIKSDQYLTRRKYRTAAFNQLTSYINALKNKPNANSQTFPYATTAQLGIVLQWEDPHVILPYLPDKNQVLEVWTDHNNKGMIYYKIRKTTLIISKKPGNTGISRDIRTEFTTDLLLSD